ncbi:TetR/AcrR family transcriptional regulator [Microbacterium gilvum]|uniref:HTH tetR-type domain-containing protein n=1 Tax=Microbacterium gilvum TaxID=1336204 RepID=A0ABP9AQP1_9MICO
MGESAAQRTRDQREADAASVSTSPERERLLGLVTDLILRDGVIDLSLSAIGRGIGSNNRMLLYYFGSKEKLLHEASLVAFERFPRLGSMFARLAAPGELADRLDAAWEDLAAEENRPYIALFFQRFGIAMRDREQWHAYVDRSTHYWAEDLADILRDEGSSPGDALALATQIVALWRGLQLALLADGDEALLRTAYRAGVRALLAGDFSRR